MADQGKKIGRVTHYYDHINVGIVKLDRGLKTGAEVQFKGKTTDFTQSVDSMQFDHQEIKSGKKGQEVGIKTAEKVRKGDGVYLIE